MLMSGSRDKQSRFCGKSDVDSFVIALRPRKHIGPPPPCPSMMAVLHDGEPPRMHLARVHSATATVLWPQQERSAHGPVHASRRLSPCTPAASVRVLVTDLPLSPLAAQHWRRRRRRVLAVRLARHQQQHGPGLGVQPLRRQPALPHWRIHHRGRRADCLGGTFWRFIRSIPCASSSSR